MPLPCATTLRCRRPRGFPLPGRPARRSEVEFERGGRAHPQRARESLSPRAGGGLRRLPRIPEGRLPVARPGLDPRSRSALTIRSKRMNVIESRRSGVARARKRPVVEDSQSGLALRLGATALAWGCFGNERLGGPIAFGADGRLNLGLAGGRRWRIRGACGPRAGCARIPAPPAANVPRRGHAGGRCCPRVRMRVCGSLVVAVHVGLHLPALALLIRPPPRPRTRSRKKGHRYAEPVAMRCCSARRDAFGARLPRAKPVRQS